MNGESRGTTNVISSHSRLAAQMTMAVICVAAACGDDADHPGLGTHDAAVRAESDAAPPAVAARAYRIKIVVPNVPAGSEGTKCVKLRLGNTDPLKIGRVHNQLFGQSHHFIVSSVTDASAAEESLFDCPPFRAQMMGAPLTVTQKHDEEIVLPKGVGYALGVDQLMHLELHYINTTDETADVSAESELFPIESDAEIEEAGFLIVGNLDIAIPPRSSHSSGDIYVAVPQALEGVNYYAVTGHTHQYGTNVTVNVAASPDGEGSPIYDLSMFEWSAPEVRYLDPPIRVPTGGGFRFSCSWDNPTDQTVRYGESALTEMCFFWAYYYPKHPMQQTLLHLPKQAM
jgi:hypothetical protein